jgi:hypothetical protein
MPEILEHVIVTMVAAGAAAVIVRRVAGIVRPRRGAGATPCDNCPSASEHRPDDAAAPTAKPLTLVRR